MYGVRKQRRKLCTVASVCALVAYVAAPGAPRSARPSAVPVNFRARPVGWLDQGTDSRAWVWEYRWDSSTGDQRDLATVAFRFVIPGHPDQSRVERLWVGPEQHGQHAHGVHFPHYQDGYGFVSEASWEWRGRGSGGWQPVPGEYGHFILKRELKIVRGNWVYFTTIHGQTDHLVLGPASYSPPAPPRDVCPSQPSEISFWKDVISHRPPVSVQRSLRSRGWNTLPIEDAAGDDTSLDFFPILVMEFPRYSSGRRLSASELLEYIRLHFNAFNSPSLANYEPYDASDKSKWESSSPLGAVIHIDLRIPSDLPPTYSNPDDGSVVVSQSTSQDWVFSTLWTNGDLAHPVSGNRQFGYAQMSTGAYVFYTRGADRPTRWIDSALAPVLFLGQTKVWKSYQARVAQFVNAHGGKAKVCLYVQLLRHWSAVKPYWHPSRPWVK
jgi:hypothetical protein